MSKKELRKNIINQRLALSAPEVAEKSAAIARGILNLKEYRLAKTIMAYVDFRNEVQTGEFIEKAMADGKRVAVPLTDIRGKRLIPSLLVDFPGDLAPGLYGIPEPKEDCLRPLDPKELDMVIVPGVAFDKKGNRLGYGGGFYDRFLPRTRTGCLWLSPAYELQIQPGVYPGEHDIPVHVIVTEKNVIKCRNQH